MKPAQVEIVYFNPEKMKQKELEPLTPEEIRKAFNNKDILVFQNSAKLKEYLVQQSWKNKNLLMMSSGNFGGIDIPQLAEMLQE
jgi:UDP-N-acetylmuramate: L-alanyl-gamma-D-glutamyl-meso-diaminopimelate ligase